MMMHHRRAAHHDEGCCHSNSYDEPPESGNKKFRKRRKMIKLTLSTFYNTLTKIGRDEDVALKALQILCVCTLIGCGCALLAKMYFEGYRNPYPWWPFNPYDANEVKRHLGFVLKEMPPSHVYKIPNAWPVSNYYESYFGNLAFIVVS